MKSGLGCLVGKFVMPSSINCNGYRRLLLGPLWLGKERVLSFFEGALLCGH